MKLLRKVVRNAFGKRSDATVTPALVQRLILEGKLGEAAAAIDRLDPTLRDRELFQTCLRGEVAFHERRDEEAERLFRSVLDQSPGFADAHYGLSVLRYSKSDNDAALRYAIFAVHGDASPRILAQLGLCYLAGNNFAKAGDFLLRAVRAEPRDKASWNNLGIARRAVGNLEGARAAFARALALDPQDARALDNAKTLAEELQRGAESRRKQGNNDDANDLAPEDAQLLEVRALMREGRAEEAQALCEGLLDASPDKAEVALELSEIFWKTDEPQMSLDVLWAFHARHPDHSAVRTRLGYRLVRVGANAPARPLLEKALEVDPDDVEALLGLAEVRFDKQQFAEAGRLFERAYALRPTIDVQGQLMSALLAQCRYAEVLAMIEDMEAKDPSVTQNVLTFRIDSLTGLGRHEEVLPAIDKQLAIRPLHPGLRFSRASILLAREDYAQGWEDYSYRNIQDSQYARMFQFKTWRGEPLEGKSILVAADQGIGDQVMFSSCLADVVAQRPARILVEVIHRLEKTIQRSFPGIEVIGSGQDRQMPWLVGKGHFDYCCLMADLPRYLRKDRASFPPHSGYLMAAQNSRERWRAKLNDVDGGRRPRIGFSWKGGTERTRTTLRTMDILEFLRLQGSVEATWVCLQYGDVGEPLSRAQDAGRSVAYWKEGIDDLDEFAALVSELDLIVTVCNTTVHYAGALGKPVWVLTPRIPEWRYGLEFRSMPWYPTSVIFRQLEAGSWDTVLSQVGRELAVWGTQVAKECQKPGGLTIA
jgi:tetratricopeptide (TPR) repeat protein